MGKVYDDWERLVEAVLRREKLRQLCYNHSTTPSQSSTDSSALLDDHATMAMVRLQEELISTLSQYEQCFDEGNVPRPSCGKGSIYEESVVLGEHHLVHNASQGGTESEDYVPELVPQDMIPRLKSIANIMFASNYDQEFCQAFVGFGRGAFAVYLTILNAEAFNIEDVAQTDWKCLNSRIRKWRIAIKNFIGHCLAKAKHLFDQVLGEYGHISSSCLIKASETSLLCFLSFGNAVAVKAGSHKQERLFCWLDMCDDLAALIPSVEALFPEDIGYCIVLEFFNLLAKLQSSAKLILKEFVSHISSSSSSLIPNGGIHPCTSYVVNYILHLADYDHTLNLLLEEELNEGLNPNLEQSISTPVAAYLQSITSVLEASIDKISNLYKDRPLKHIYLMNNIHYMVEKIKNSKIETYFGEEWIKSHTWKFRFHAMSYQRNTWSSILSLLRDDAKADRATLKAKCRDFTLAFKNVYKKQTGWCVQNLHLREELRILASINVVHAYWCFVGRFSYTIGEKHIKYTGDDLEIYISDLLEGSSKSLNPSGKGQKA